MLALTSASNSSNVAIANTLDTSSLPVNSPALLTASSGLVDPLQQSALPISASSSTDAVAKAGIIVIGGTPQSALNSPGDLVSLNPQPLPPKALADQAIASSVLTSNSILTTPILTTPILGTPGGSTLATATDLGTLNGTRALYDLIGVSSSSPDDYYRVTLGANSNFNLSMTGLSADADVQFLNSLGEEIARSAYAQNHDEAINLSGLAAGDYYIRVYQFSGNTGFFLDLSTTNPSNLVPQEFELGTVYSTGTTQTGFLSNSNTADVYHFNVDGYYSWGGDFPGSAYASTSNLTLSLTGLGADADVRIIRDVNLNGLIDPGEEIVRSSSNDTNSETINLGGLGVGDYFVQVYQYSGATSYTLNLSANGDLGGEYTASNHPTLRQAYEFYTLNGHRAASGQVGGGGDNPSDSFYHFNLGATSNVNLSLGRLYNSGENLLADADVYLLDSSGTLIKASASPGTAPESISQTLAAGNYYVRVSSFDNALATFTLDLNATPV